MTKTRILLLTNYPAPYMVDYLNELSLYCSVTAVFEFSTAAHRDKSWAANTKSWAFEHHFLSEKPKKKKKTVSFRVRHFLADKGFDKIIIANPTTPTGIFELLYCRFHKIPFIIQSEGGFQGSGKGLKEKFKKFIMEKAVFYLTGMGGPNDYFLKYGAEPNKLKRFPFTSLKESDMFGSYEELLEERKKWRSELGFDSSSLMILYVGMFNENKGVKVLLEANGYLNNDRVNLVLVGGTPTADYQNIVYSTNKHNVKFVGFLPKNELRKYYLAADVFVLPTYSDTWGLVINEAMSFGLPVISTSKCIAALELLTYDQFNCIVSPGRPEELAEKITILCDDASLRKRLSIYNFNRIRDYTIERMTSAIFKAINGHTEEC